MKSLRALATLTTLATTLAACAASPAPDGGADVPNDLATTDGGMDATAPTDAAPDADAGPALPPWPHELPPGRVLTDARGLVAARAIIHAHSVHSHDACDNHPYVDGGVNEPCLADFRRDVCRANLDVVLLTEHAGLMAEGPFERVLQVRDGDTPVRDDSGALIGYEIPCPDAHHVLVVPGSENELMPLGLLHHPDVPAGSTMDDVYHAYDPAGVARFRAAGALVAIAHTEQRTLADLTALGPDMIELYNIHANIDPSIAQTYLGLDVGPRLADLLQFATSHTLEPDLGFLAIFTEAQPDLDLWSSLLAAGAHLPASGGTDSHENSFPATFPDGERGDSYRRMFRWFSNALLLDGPPTRERVLDAIHQGRMFVAFEAYGTPSGFAYTATTTAGATAEIGARLALTDAPVLHVAPPSVYALDPSLPAPTMRLRVLRATAAGWVEVAAADAAAGPLAYTPTQPGAYRAEVRIVPNHARPYLPRMERLIHDVPWVYASPIYVE